MGDCIHQDVIVPDTRGPLRRPDPVRRNGVDKELERHRRIERVIAERARSGNAASGIARWQRAEIDRGLGEVVRNNRLPRIGSTVSIVVEEGFLTVGKTHHGDDPA